MGSLIRAIDLLSFSLTLVVLIDIVVGYFVSPLHPLRRTLDSIVEPMLAPIRRLVPPMGMFDLSPIVLMLLIQFVGSILTRVLRALG